MFGMILSIFIAFFIAYVAFFIFFELTKINGYIRLFLSGIVILGLGYYIMFIMNKFW